MTWSQNVIFLKFLSVAWAHLDGSLMKFQLDVDQLWGHLKAWLAWMTGRDGFFTHMSGTLAEMAGLSISLCLCKASFLTECDHQVVGYLITWLASSRASILRNSVVSGKILMTYVHEKWWSHSVSALPHSFARYKGRKLLKDVYGKVILWEIIFGD